jgi:hypothetical protein
MFLTVFLSEIEITLMLFYVDLILNNPLFDSRFYVVFNTGQTLQVTDQLILKTNIISLIFKFIVMHFIIDELKIFFIGCIKQTS